MANQELLEQLIQRKFHGITPKWKRARFGQIEVLHASDNTNWYSYYGGIIIIQNKDTKRMRCYECGGPITHIDAPVNLATEECDRDGKIKTFRIPYCASCKPKLEDYRS